MVQMIGTLLITALARPMIDLQVDTGVFNKLVATFSAQRVDIQKKMQKHREHTRGVRSLTRSKWNPYFFHFT